LSTIEDALSAIDLELPPNEAIGLAEDLLGDAIEMGEEPDGLHLGIEVRAGVMTGPAGKAPQIKARLTTFPPVHVVPDLRFWTPAEARELAFRLLRAARQSEEMQS